GFRRLLTHLSCAGRSASKTRVNALMTRASISFARSLYEEGWIAPELGLARVPHFRVPQVGRARLAVSSPAMTTLPQRRSAGAGARRSLERVARVEQHRAALLHVSVDVLERLARGLCCARDDRPIDQRIERKLVARGIEPDWLTCLERRALGQEQGETLQPGLADAVDLGIAGDDIAEAGLERGSQRLLVGVRRACGRLVLR